ncbi:MAG: FliG C-terminal domain-containing protein [Pirellulales bacterium]|nr:FliG C-terminal domain-containing protein [Pirellulales bacterium]
MPSLTTLTPLEKAAVLISTLDRDSADRLLEQMTPAQAQLVRRAVLDLDDISPETQQAVLAEFLGGAPAIGTTTAKISPLEEEFTEDEVTYTSGPGGVELSLHHNEQPAVTYEGDVSAAWPGSSARPVDPFAALHAAESDLLLRLLEREQPQTVAVVLAHLPPSRAAELLAKLPQRQQVDLARRMIDLDVTDSAVLQEIAAVFTREVEQHTRQQRRRASGVHRLAEILAVSAETTEHQVLQNLPHLREELAPRLRVLRAPRAAPLDSLRDQRVSTRALFADFQRLDPRHALHVLQISDPGDAVLALASAEADFVQSVGRELPRHQAVQLLDAIRQVGQATAAERAAAQAAVIRTALELGYLRAGPAAAYPDKPRQLAA